MDIQMIKLVDLHPYENNPRFNDGAVDAVAKSIEEFGFKVPLVIDRDNVIVCGHTRYKAAQKLKLETVPCLIADDLTPEQIKAFRLAENKVGELAQWDIGALAVELDDLAAMCVEDMADFGFDTTELWRRQAAWKQIEKYCNLKKRVKTSSHGDFRAATFFETNKRGDGETITRIKENPDNVGLFVDCLADYLSQTLGANLAMGDWCIVTTPRRRHKDFHFSTAICESAAKVLGLKFYVDAVSARTRGRIEPEFTLEVNPAEVNVILFDDVVSTGETLRATRKLLSDTGHVTLLIVAIKN